MTPFAETLKSWRNRQRMSQMALALSAEVSTRHVSYLETGKASPSREMVLRLAEALRVPVHARNDWLTSAGYAPVFQRRDLDSEALRPFMAAVEHVIARHDPFPAWVLDADWRIIRVNQTGEILLGVLGIAPGDNLVSALTADPSRGGLIESWRETVAHLSARLSAEARRRNDPKTAEAARALAAHWPHVDVSAPDTPAKTTVISLNRKRLELISIQAVFNTATDLSLADLRTELFYPVDANSERALETLFVRTGASSAKAAGGGAPSLRP